MNQKLPEELLSAYFDGEVTPEERLQVESLLQSSPEARQQLDEWKEISNLLGEVPAANAPAELSSWVQRETERQLLLPPPAPQRSSTRRQRIWLLTTCATTACLAVSVLLYQQFQTINRSEAPQSPAIASTPRDAYHSELSKRNFFVVPEAEMSDFASLGQKVNSGGMASDGVDSNDEMLVESVASNSVASNYGSRMEEGQWNRGVAPGTTMLKAGEAAAGGTMDGSADMAGETAPEALSYATLPKKPAGREQHWAMVRIGDVVPYLEQQQDDQVAVIDVTVIDVRKALGVMQVLMMRNDIPQEDAKTPAESESLSTKERVFAVYVEASPEQMLATFDELEHQDLFVEMKLQPPASIADNTENQLAQLVETRFYTKAQHQQIVSKLKPATQPMAMKEGDKADKDAVAAKQLKNTPPEPPSVALVPDKTSLDDRKLATAAPSVRRPAKGQTPKTETEAKMAVAERGRQARSSFQRTLQIPSTAMAETSPARTAGKAEDKPAPAAEMADRDLKKTAPLSLTPPQAPAAAAEPTPMLAGIDSLKRDVSGFGGVAATDAAPKRAGYPVRVLFLLRKQSERSEPQPAPAKSSRD